jgi:ATP-dependent Lon protease
MEKGLTKRDMVAVERLSSGLIKLLYPDGNLTNDELREVAELACEMRQRIHDQLVVLAPGEFHPKIIGLSR